MDIINQLKDITLFQGVSPEKIKSLAAQSILKKFKAGDLVIGESDPVRSFFVVISGQLKLYRSSAEGKEQTLQLLSSGDPFGLCTAFATDSFPASAMAIEESIDFRERPLPIDDVDSRAALTVAVQELVRLVVSGEREHRADLSTGRTVLALIAEAQRQIDAKESS